LEQAAALPWHTPMSLIGYIIDGIYVPDEELISAGKPGSLASRR
jgi:hypothetical protein